jgi:hypothetical protein
MDGILDALAAIGGLAFGAIVILLMAPTLDSMTPVNLTAWGVALFGGAVVLTIVLILVTTKTLVSEL